jgi:hypothetical protein
VRVLMRTRSYSRTTVAGNNSNAEQCVTAAPFDQYPHASCREVADPSD